MNFKQMEAFYWLTQLQSYRQVAEKLSLTQPAVSARIASLEEAMNIRLIDRDATHFRLTEQGQHVAEYAEMFVNLHEAMTGRLDEGRRRHFAVGMVSMVTLTWGVLLRELVAEAAPNVFLDFHSGSNRDLRRLLRAGVLDMAFLTDEDDLARVPNSFTVQYQVGWLANPEVIANKPQPMSGEDLRTLPAILYQPSSPLSHTISDALTETKVRPNARHVGNSLPTILDMMRLGYGVSPVVLSVAEADLKAGTLVQIETVDPVAPLDISCIHVNRARKDQVRLIYQFAEEAAQRWCAENPRFATFMPATP